MTGNDQLEAELEAELAGNLVQQYERVPGVEAVESCGTFGVVAIFADGAVDGYDEAESRIRDEFPEAATTLSEADAGDDRHAVRVTYL